MLKAYDNGNDTVVAESVEDAWLVWEGTTGEHRVDYDDMEWEVLFDSVLLTIRYENRVYASLYRERPSGATVEMDGTIELVTATYGAWAKLVGRAWLCSTEY